MRAPGGPIPFVDLDAGRPEPLYQQLYDGLRRAISAGRIPRGARLPATRALAVDLGVSRTTVVQAYERLWSEGYVESRVGAGTRVADTLPEEGIRGAPPPHPPGDAAAPDAGPPRLSRRAAAAAPLMAGAAVRDEARPFFPGLPALDEFPLATWRRMTAAARASRTLLQLPEAAGDPELREVLAAHLRVSRGLRCTAAQVVITTGTQQALSHLAALLLDPGDAAWMEDPGHLGARRALAHAGARIVPVPVDAEGLQVEAGIARAPDARLAYVSPSHQFPLGVTMGSARRARLLEWARSSGAWVLEDDYDGEYRFEGRPLQALQGMDTAGRVVYVGTFSKILFPSIRLGYAVLPPPLVEPFTAARTGAEGPPPPLDQAVAAAFLRAGHFSRHLRRMRVLYRERRDALLRALRHRCGDRLRPGPAHAGMHVAAHLPAGMDDAAVAARAAADGVTACALSSFAMEPAGRGGLVLGFAGWPPARLRASAERLAHALDEA